MKPLDKFTQAYVECALWSSIDDDGTPLDANYDALNIAPETWRQMLADCAAFQESCAADLEDYPAANAGHDFWLTRNHHGAGFWENDFGTPEACKRLTECAHAYGEFNLYIGDDGMIYG